MVDFKNVVKKWDFQKTVTKIKDTKNFEIQKAGRFAARFFQGATALIMYYFLAAQQPAFTAANKLQSVNSALVYAQFIQDARSDIARCFWWTYRHVRLSVVLA